MSEASSLNETPLVIESLAPAPQASSTTRPWLLWTGVLGAIFAMVALFALVLLSQRLVALESAQAQSLQDRQQLQRLTEQVGVLQQQQASAVTKLSQEMATLSTEVDQLTQRAVGSWQLTDPVVIRFMLSQLQASALVNPNAQSLRPFLEQWQAALRMSGVDDGHALMQALQQEIRALRTDVPVWHTEAELWQQLSEAVDRASVATLTPTVATTVTTDYGWWQSLTRFIRITPNDDNATALSEQLHTRSLWRVKSALALEIIRLGFISNQPALVHSASHELQSLLAQQAVPLADDWSSRLAVWESWSGIPLPQWHYLTTYLASQTPVAP